MKPEVFINHSLNSPVFVPPVPQFLILATPMNFTHSLATRKTCQAVILLFFRYNIIASIIYWQILLHMSGQINNAERDKESA